MSARVVVRVSEDTNETIRAHAARIGSDIGAAADDLVATAKKRASASGLVVSAESLDVVRAYAERKGIDLAAAADHCIRMAQRRFDALAKYKPQPKAKASKRKKAAAGEEVSS